MTNSYHNDFSVRELKVVVWYLQGRAPHKGSVRMRSDTTTGENRYARAPLGATGHNPGEGRFIRAH